MIVAVTVSTELVASETFAAICIGVVTLNCVPKVGVMLSTDGPRVSTTNVFVVLVLRLAPTIHVTFQVLIPYAKLETDAFVAVLLLVDTPLTLVSPSIVRLHV